MANEINSTKTPSLKARSKTVLNNQEMTNEEGDVRLHKEIEDLRLQPAQLDAFAKSVEENRQKMAELKGMAEAKDAEVANSRAIIEALKADNDSLRRQVMAGGVLPATEAPVLPTVEDETRDITSFIDQLNSIEASNREILAQALSMVAVPQDKIAEIVPQTPTEPATAAPEASAASQPADAPQAEAPVSAAPDAEAPAVGNAPGQEPLRGSDGVPFTAPPQEVDPNLNGAPVAPAAPEAPASENPTASTSAGLDVA